MKTVKYKMCIRDRLTAESEVGKGTTMTMWFLKGQDDKAFQEDDEFE